MPFDFAKGLATGSEPTTAGVIFWMEFSGSLAEKLSLKSSSKRGLCLEGNILFCILKVWDAERVIATLR